MLENSEADNRPKRGFTSTPTSQSQLTKSKGPVIPVSSAGAEVKHGEDVTEAIKDVRNDETDTVWACIGYGENNVKKPLTVSSQNFCEHFNGKKFYGSKHLLETPWLLW